MTDLKSPVPDPAPGARAPGISCAIYGMPMFATLLARDIGATVSWYTAGLGFIDLFTIPGAHGDPAIALTVRSVSGNVSIERGSAVA